MSPLIISIVFVSTFMHAGWNLLARYDRSEGEFYRKMLIVILAVGLVPAVWTEILTHSLTPLAWLCALLSGFCESLYFFFLALAFESSDFTIVYPVARSLPVIFIGIMDTMRGHPLTPLGWTGIVLVAGGCILVPQSSFRAFSGRNYFSLTTLWMVLTAAATVGYTLSDKIAAEALHSGPATAARYGFFYFTVALIPYTAFLMIFKKGKVLPELKGWKLAIPAGFLSFGAYWLILWVFQLDPYASYITAFRQFSIVIGAALAFIIYKEKGISVRITGALLITCGLVLIALWGR